MAIRQKGNQTVPTRQVRCFVHKPKRVGPEVLTLLRQLQRKCEVVLCWDPRQQGAALSCWCSEYQQEADGRLSWRDKKRVYGLKKVQQLLEQLLSKGWQSLPTK